MEESSNLNSPWFIFAYSLFLAAIVYSWNPTDAEGMARISTAILIIVAAGIFGAARRALFGIDLNQSRDGNK